MNEGVFLHFPSSILAILLLILHRNHAHLHFTGLRAFHAELFCLPRQELAGEMEKLCQLRADRPSASLGADPSEAKW
jgi:hypothetical protein